MDTASLLALIFFLNCWYLSLITMTQKSVPPFLGPVSIFTVTDAVVSNAFNFQFFLAVLILTTGFYVGCINNKLLDNTTKELKSHGFNDWVTITLTRTEFGHDEPIPIQHTDDGANILPPLYWSKFPAGTHYLV